MREVYETLREPAQIAYTTVMTVMNNLVKKHLLDQDKTSIAYVYTPAIPGREVAQTVLDSVVHDCSAASPTWPSPICSAWTGAHPGADRTSSARRPTSASASERRRDIGRASACRSAPFYICSGALDPEQLPSPAARVALAAWHRPARNAATSASSPSTRQCL